jgi:hypothetical protein
MLMCYYKTAAFHCKQVLINEDSKVEHRTAAILAPPLGCKQTD